MFEIYLFNKNILRIGRGNFSGYGIYFSPVFNCYTSHHRGLEFTRTAPFLKAKLDFGDLFEFDLPRDFPRLRKYIKTLVPPFVNPRNRKAGVMGNSHSPAKESHFFGGYPANFT
jgi:hypothetical protein